MQEAYTYVCGQSYEMSGINNLDDTIRDRLNFSQDIDRNH